MLIAVEPIRAWGSISSGLCVLGSSRASCIGSGSQGVMSSFKRMINAETGQSFLQVMNLY